MKVIAFNGSPRKQGNTYLALTRIMAELEKQGIETEIVHVGGMDLKGCIGCNKCVQNRDGKCALPDDGLNELVQKFKEADGIILASPVHYSDVTARMKAFLDRAFYVSNNSGNFLRHKVGAALTVVRRTGGIHTLDTLTHYLTYCEMVIPGSFYWCVNHGGVTIGEVEQDTEGMQIMSRLGKNMAWVLQSLDYAKEKLPAPEVEKRQLFSYIR